MRSSVLRTVQEEWRLEGDVVRFSLFLTLFWIASVRISKIRTQPKVVIFQVVLSGAGIKKKHFCHSGVG
jgi:hypothetical protein